MIDVVNITLVYQKTFNKIVVLLKNRNFQFGRNYFQPDT